ncbi:type III-B CRISPR-associated protein Cas10/Cmr2 [Leadbettera azotonutricia]|uniref:Hydrolase of the HD superfamily n=1 Tax=Leadbettera azotonutricia (strain ATCC BAA-888 / DSM 13862 / ZAS-9) TaxID=545695 RepID=F5YD03_LEAAZ|nr:type III-B CRISPR-associated protein Cas10/Cmr2 [Leadbettera azotonutricia]AEF83118.1 hydrolase of the HD superfamily [Leadbettera azotonutricia ZAS-9]
MKPENYWHKKVTLWQDAIVRGLIDGLAKDGAFIKSPAIIHPLVGEKLPLDLPVFDVGKLQAELKGIMDKDLGLLSEKNGLAPGTEAWADAAFQYFFFAFPKRLRLNNAGGFGALWDILPGDPKDPDNSLWQQLSFKSAFESAGSMDASGKAALVAFSITPVQDFIGHARKLRDFWAGSILLSYLAFAGLSHVMRELGPDHILYPSLHNQSMINDLLEDKYKLKSFLIETDAQLAALDNGSVSIAAFPNKFVFVAPKESASLICREIEKTINDEWIRQAEIVKKYIADRTGSGAKFDALWSNQIDSYWKFSWAKIKFLAPEDKDKAAKLLPPDKWEKEFVAGNVMLYGASHSLVQGVLAAGKMKPLKLKNIQEGEKCPLCGEHEALHSMDDAGNTKAQVYSAGIKEFWKTLGDRTNPEKDNYTQVGKNERLCAICAVKRFLPIAIQKTGNRILYNALFDSKFPSTTEMAAKDFLNELKGIDKNLDEKKITDAMYNNEIEPEGYDFQHEASYYNISYTNKDKYYALLLMDGDKMGDLINGSTIKTEKTMSPALHAAISDSLNNFARYGVNSSVVRGRGRLIYAGGDDVCAIMPVSTAIETADEIRKAYTLSFAAYNNEGAYPVERGSPGLSKISLHLGSGAEGISISGAIVIAHYKEPLREVIRSAHEVLEGIAKHEAGRNALAIRLSKRSGGDRNVWFKWDENESSHIFGGSRLSSFKTLIQGVAGDRLSTSLLYRLAEKAMETSLEPLVKSDTEDNRAKIAKLFRYELGHSDQANKSLTKEELENYTNALAGVSIIKKPGSPKLIINQEAVIIAAFLASGREG